RTQGFRIHLLAGHKPLVLPAYQKEVFLTVGGVDGTIALVELATGKPLYLFDEFDVKDLRKFTLSPDGNRVAAAVQSRAGREESMALLWDVQRLHREARRQATSLTARDLDACWAELAGKDMFRVHRAMRGLVNTPGQTVPFLQKHLRPVPGG